MDGKIRQKYSEIPFNHFKQVKEQIILESDRSIFTSSILMQQNLEVEKAALS